MQFTKFTTLAYERSVQKNAWINSDGSFERIFWYLHSRHVAKTKERYCLFIREKEYVVHGADYIIWSWFDVRSKNQERATSKHNLNRND